MTSAAVALLAPLMVRLTGLRVPEVVLQIARTDSNPVCIRSDTSGGFMEAGRMLTEARRAAGLSQDELASRAGTSRPTLSSYEHGHRSPTRATADRLLSAAGYELTATPMITFTEQPTRRGHAVLVPSHLPRLSPAHALATVTLPLHLNWSHPGRTFDMRDRRQRARVYEIVLREGTPNDLIAYVDGVLLADLWPDLVLSRDIRAAWEPLVARTLTVAA